MAIRNATLHTVHAAGVSTRGSFDVDLEISQAELDRLASADGETLEIAAVVEGGHQKTAAGGVQAKREYPALECIGENYGPVTILGLVAGKDLPALQIGQTLMLRVGPIID